MRNKIKKDVKRAPVTYRQKQLMLAVLMRSEEAFKAVSPRLRVSHFREMHDRPLAVVWDVLCTVHKQNDELPSSEILSTEISARLEDDPELLSDDQIEDVDALLTLSEELKIGLLERKTAMAYARRLIEEGIQVELNARMADPNSFLDLPTILEETKVQVDTLYSLETGEIAPFFPENLEDIPPVIVEPTAINWIDDYMDGGMVRKEVYGFLGPFGSCKTTLSVMLSINRARWEQDPRYNGGKTTGPYPIVYLVAWEEEREQLQLRGLCYAGQIHKNSLVGADWHKNLSTAQTLKPYELKKREASIKAGCFVPGESERLSAAVKQLNRNLTIVDFTGADRRYRDLSCQMARGVAAAIEADQAARGNPGVSMVVLDYAGAAAKRAISRSGQDVDRVLRHMIGDMPLSAKAEIAVPFNCSVWIMHQTGTEAQSRSTGMMPKAIDAAEGRNFAENLNFAFMIGTVTDQNLCGLVVRKQRRSARKAPRILRIDGSFATVEDVSADYVIRSSQIAVRTSAEQISDGREPDEDPPVTALVKPPAATRDSLFSDLGDQVNVKSRPTVPPAQPVRPKRREST